MVGILYIGDTMFVETIVLAIDCIGENGFYITIGENSFYFLTQLNCMSNSVVDQWNIVGQWMNYSYNLVVLENKQEKDVTKGTFLTAI